MTPAEIKAYRPSRWLEFIGNANEAPIRRLQQAAISGRPPLPMLLIAPYGMGKTSLARHLMKAFGCPHRDTQTGDPCNQCDECRRIGPEFNREGLIYPRWEVDCTRVTSKVAVLDLLAEVEQDNRASLFFDEFHRLARREVADALLKFAEDFPVRFRGLFMIAVTDDRFAAMPPPLFERLRKIWLRTPNVSEMAAYFSTFCVQAELVAPEPLVFQLVMRSQSSFRTCFDVLAGVKEQGTQLTPEILDEFLPPAPDEAADTEESESSGV